MFYMKPRPQGHGYYLGHKDNIDNEFNYRKHRESKKAGILRAVRGGEMQIREIAKHFDVHERTIARWCREAGIPGRCNPRPDKLRHAIYDAYVNSTMTVVAIGAKFGVDWSESGVVRHIAETWARQEKLPWRVRLQGAGRGHLGVRFGPWQKKF